MDFMEDMILHIVNAERVVKRRIFPNLTPRVRSYPLSLIRSSLVARGGGASSVLYVNVEQSRFFADLRGREEVEPRLREVRQGSEGVQGRRPYVAHRGRGRRGIRRW